MFPPVRHDEETASPYAASPVKRDRVLSLSNNLNAESKATRPLKKTKQQNGGISWNKKKAAAMQVRLETGNAKNNPRIVNLLEQLMRLQEEQAVGDFYYYYLLVYSRQLPLDRLEDLLGRQLRNLRQRETYYHQTLKAVEARELCLSSIKVGIDGLKSLRKNQAESDTKLRTFGEEISHYRKLTLHIIDTVRKWKDWLHSLDPRSSLESPSFFFNGENYLIKMLSDTNFLATTFLADHLVVATKNDPFILRPLKEERNSSNQKYLKVLDCDEELRKRMVKSLEFLASEKADELKNKIYGRDDHQVINTGRPQAAYASLQSDVETTQRQRRPVQLVVRHSKEKKGPILNYETDVEKNQQWRALERERERLDRLEKNQQRINAIKNIYQAKNLKLALGKNPFEKDYNTNIQTDNEAVTKLQTLKSGLQNHSSMPRLKNHNTQSRYKSLGSNKKLNLMAATSKPQTLKEDEDFQRLLRNKEIQVLRGARNMAASTRLKDKLVTKRLLEDKDGLRELEKAVGSISQNKLMSSVKGMESDIKQKLASMKQDNFSIPVMPLKQNDDLIKQMKAEILKKLEKENEEREKYRRSQREQEQRMLEEMRSKLRREFEDRIKEQKRKKQLEREQLQRQLKVEEQRIMAQKKLEIQLQQKLNSQKNNLELQRIRKQTAEKQQELRALIQKQRQERLKLQDELSKRVLQSTVEEEVKQQLQLKLQRQAKAEAMAPRQQQLEKELQMVRIKEALQLERLRKENDERDRLLRARQEEEQQRRQNIEELMRKQLEQQKSQMEAKVQDQRNQLQSQLRADTNKQMLEKLKAERTAAYEQAKRDRERDIEEEVYRQKMRQKLQRQMRIQVIQKTKQQLEEREVRKKQVTLQLEEAQAQMAQKLAAPIDKSRIEAEVKRQVIEKSLNDKHIQKEVAKTQLRDQFQKELFGSVVPDMYSQKDDYQLKNIQVYKEDRYLDAKLIQHSQPVQVKPTESSINISAVKAQTEMARVENTASQASPTKKLQQESRSSLLESKGDMTEEQYQVYLKKKRGLQTMREKSIKKIEVVQQKDDPEYEKVVVKNTKRPLKESSSKEKERDVAKALEKKKDRARQYELRKAIEQQQRLIQKAADKIKKKSKKRSESSSEEEERQPKKKTKKARRQEESEEEEDLSYKKTTNKKQKNRRQQPFSSSEQERVRYHSKKKRAKQPEQSEEEQEEQVRFKSKRKTKQDKKSTSRQRSQSRLSQRFHTSDSDAESDKPAVKPKKTKSKKKVSDSESSSRSDSVQQIRGDHYDSTSQANARQPSLRLNSQEQENQVTTSKFQTKSNSQKIQISVDAIQEGELDEYLGGHFLRLPKDQADVLPLKRHDLYRKLIGEVTFSMLVGQEEGKTIGLCLAYHDRNKHDHRKFVLAHIGSYYTNRLFEFLIEVCHYIFRKDPTDQIQFVYRYDQSVETQLQFSNNFNGRFDKHGAIFQKRMPDTDNVYERKYVMKRPFNLKCEVKLGGVNKANFGNLFSVNASVLVSNTDLVKAKDQLADPPLSATATPERELSYAVLVNQIFRNCLSPDEAEILKQKVKEYLKLKQLLVLVVLLEKKKVKIAELNLTEYKSLTQLNMRLMSQGKEIIRLLKDPGVSHNRVFHCELSQAFKLPFQFQTTALPLEHGDETLHINYFRMAAIAPHKLYTIKSSLYNTEMHVLPTQNPGFKLFMMSGAEYNQIKDKNNIDLFMYLRVFLKNVKSHNAANWKYVWVPEIKAKGAFWVREYRAFLDKDFYAMDSINISYRQFLPGALIIQPEHKDLVITPPFIVGILSVALEQVSQGSPLYIRLLDIDSLKVLEVQ